MTRDLNNNKREISKKEKRKKVLSERKLIK
jgi:hypothetical protein